MGSASICVRVTPSVWVEVIRSSTTPDTTPSKSAARAVTSTATASQPAHGHTTAGHSHRTRTCPSGGGASGGPLRGGEANKGGSVCRHATSEISPLTPRPLTTVTLAPTACPVAYAGWEQYGHMYGQSRTRSSFGGRREALGSYRCSSSCAMVTLSRPAPCSNTLAPPPGSRPADSTNTCFTAAGEKRRPTARRLSSSAPLSTAEPAPPRDWLAVASSEPEPAPCGLLRSKVTAPATTGEATEVPDSARQPGSAPRLVPPRRLALDVALPGTCDPRTEVPRAVRSGLKRPNPKGSSNVDMPRELNLAILFGSAASPPTPMVSN
mmetsp:Transcript_43551/g.98440  ORF Transcript_43551/g.98440 Transcript_43551/m.98440 type:complete len:323 (-) Transcript_43551:484-1452(-)